MAAAKENSIMRVSPPNPETVEHSETIHNDAAIWVAGLEKNYGPVKAVRGIDLSVRHGEIFGLIGPDGAGKSSVFQILGGVMPATSGEAIILGRSAREARSYVGYLTQVFSLYHDLSVAENLRYMGELRRLSHQGITIVVATPYLDEAERCSRVALMHEGRIHRTGTPRELRHNLGLKRLVVRTPALGRTEDLLHATPGITDAQRFGDHIDVMVKDSSVGERLTRETLSKAGIQVQEINAAWPTLENTFVAMLRQSNGDIQAVPFPLRHRSPERASNAIAIGARNLSKRFGNFDAVKNVSLEVRYGEIYGLLGANGAGKTTTIKMLCGLIESSSGEAQLAGETGSLRSGSVRQHVGYMSQKFSLYDDL